MDAYTEMAQMFKDRDKPKIPSITTGTVVAAPPEIKIRLNEIVVLNKNHLIFSAHVLGGYKRNIKFSQNNAGGTDTVNDGGYQASSHSHSVSVDIDTEMEWTDTLQEGDEVILMPTPSEQLYVVIDKAVRLE